MDKLEQYLKSNPRNKLAFCIEQVAGFDFMDIGYELSLAIQDKVGEANAIRYGITQVAGLALDELKRILNDNQHEHPEFGKYVAITNIGILLEPELKIDIDNLFEQYSKSALLIVNNKNLDLPKITTTSIQI